MQSPFETEVIVVRKATFVSKRAEALALHAAGLSCRGIADALGFAASTVSKWAKREGLSFDRSKTDLATRAHTIDLAESRMLLTQKLMVVAHAEVDSLTHPYLVFNFGGKDNTYEEHTLAVPPVEVKRSVFMMAGVAFDKSTRILEKDNGGLDEAVGTLDTLAAGFAAAADALRAQDETPTDGA